MAVKIIDTREFEDTENIKGKYHDNGISSKKFQEYIRRDIFIYGRKCGYIQKIKKNYGGDYRDKVRI